MVPRDACPARALSMYSLAQDGCRRSAKVGAGLKSNYFPRVTNHLHGWAHVVSSSGRVHGAGKVDLRLPENGYSSTHGARTVR